ncbi:MAG: Mu-like prophage major head subunit gpT family protein [Cyanobacteria bacterium P01_H01_bin.74]
MPQNEYPLFDDSNLRGEFLRIFDEISNKSFLNELAMYIDSNSEAEDLGWLGSLPVLTPWDGERTFSQMNEYTWRIYNEQFQAGLQIKKLTIDRDKLNAFLPKVAMFGERAAQNPMKLAGQLLLNSETQACYDGVSFFSPQHPIAPGATTYNNNDITFSVQNPTSPTVTEVSDSILKGISQLSTFRDDQGEPVNQGITSVKVICSPLLFDRVLGALSNKLIGGGNDNTISNSNIKITMHSEPRLTTWVDKIAVMETSSFSKPFIHQVEQETDFVSVYDPLNKVYKWGVDRSEAVAFGDYKKSVLITYQ